MTNLSNYLNDKDSETLLAKILFTTVMWVVAILFAIVMNFVIMYRGWGQSVQSWGWIIFLACCGGVVGGIKHIVVEAIKKI